MLSLLDYTSYHDAQVHFSREAVNALFDNDSDHNFNIAYECVDRHAALSRPALQVLRADETIEKTGFQELATLSSQIAHWLKLKEVTSGERVAIILQPGSRFAACAFGTMKLGAVVVPLFSLFGAQALQERIDAASPAVVFVEHELAGLVASLEGKHKTVVADDAFFAELERFDSTFTSATHGSDAAVHLFTSGTTKTRPTAVRFMHNALKLLVPSVLYGQGLRPGDTLFCPSSPAWGHGFWYGLVAPLAFGITTCTMAGRFQPERMLDAMKRFEADTLAAAPTTFRMIKKSGLLWHGPALRKISYSGEAMDEPTARWVAATFGAPPCSMYGTTEVGVVLGNYPGADDYVVKPGSLGKPYPGSIVEVHDQTGRPCAPGIVGEIRIRRKDRWIPTRDLGHIDDDGVFFHDGRADDVIVSAGWTMSAVEIEDVLREHDQVQDVAVIGVPDSLRGHIPKAYVVPRGVGNEELVESLQSHVRERLGAHEFPRLVEFLAEIPSTPAGKINRKALRERHQNATSGVLP